MDYVHDFDDWELHEDKGSCPHCHGRGYHCVEPNSSLTYRCDCNENNNTRQPTQD